MKTQDDYCSIYKHNLNKNNLLKNVGFYLFKFQLIQEIINIDV